MLAPKTLPHLPAIPGALRPPACAVGLRFSRSPSLSFRPTQSVQTRATSRRTAMKGGSGGLEGTSVPAKSRHLLWCGGLDNLVESYLGCTNTATCALPHVVTAARIFFVLFNTVLVGVYARLLSRARRRTQTPDVAEDIANMEGKLKKALIKIVVLLLLHATLGLMAPLVTSCLISTVAFPFWWDRKKSMLFKYGL
ncbi:hypothetical protein AK812_SmicGene9285 [Symbiodinium microadriaticum]|uniref:Uncharacterized protein n=1 Tax=Symbiodinium microadriaticum TaxID=2951 RepID=A0A1Q9EIQ8_SYMMI|nr:hypothetical protein AK812_SmicGene9285 [Symbiodinium microadriaticum]